MRPRLACLAAAAAAFVTSADAAPLRYTISAPCLASCDSIGLETGDHVSGRFAVRDSAFQPGGVFDSSALAGFSVRVGATKLSSANVVGASLGGDWGARPSDISFVSLIAGTAVLPAAGPGFSLSTQGGFASLEASCFTSACGGAQYPGATSAQLGEAAIAPVPAPPALLLAASGLAGLVAVGRRRRRHAAR